MAWTAIKTWLPQDNLTAAQLNTHFRDNLLETLAGTVPIPNAIATVAGPNSVKWREIKTATKSTTSTTSSTSPVDVGPKIGTENIEHSGHFLLLVTAEISNSASSFTNYAVGLTTGERATTSRAVRTSTSDRVSLSTHVIHANVTSPCSFTGWLWTENAATTASVYNATYSVIPL